MFKKTAMTVIMCCLTMSVLLASCGSENDAGTDPDGTEEIDAVDLYENYQPLKAENEDEQIGLCFEHSYTKATPEYQITDTATYQVRMAKNEIENCQFILSSSEAKSGLTAQITDFTNASGDSVPAEIYIIHYIKTGDIESPDPMPKLEGSFDLEAGRSQSFIIQLRSTAETPAGAYQATLEIKSGDSVVKTAKVFAKVWDFALSDAPACDTAVGLSRGESYIYTMHNVASDDTEGREAIYKKYYDFFLENRISGYDLPYDVLDPRVDEYLSDPRVTSFRVPFYDDNYIKACYEKLSQNQEWLDKAYFYPVDEPSDKTGLNKLKDVCERLEAIYPGFNIVVPFFTDISLSKEVDQIEFMKDYVNIWCPKTFLYTDFDLKENNRDARILYTKKQNSVYAPFADRMLEEISGGDKVWWYVCWEPGFPYANMYVDMPGVVHRVLFWQQKQYNVDGFLYWNTVYWNETENPWTDMATVKTLSTSVFGDGSLLYNGSEVGVDGPVGSLRLEAIRDGVDDYDYLKMAEELIGKAETENIIKKVSTNIIDYTQDDDVFAAARIELGDAIENAIKK